MTDVIENINAITKTAYESIGTIAQYNITKRLGDEHLYPVYVAQHGEHHENSCVIKVMETDDDSFINECSIFELPEHKNIIKAKDLLTNVQVEVQDKTRELKNLKSFDTKKQQNIVVMELAENGDIFNYVTQGPFSESITRYYFEQILDAVEYLHDNIFCHLDLKLENILLDKEFTIKLTDFGFASKIEEGKRLYNKVGTPSYRPPEMWKVGNDFKGYTGDKADVFQLGVLLYIFITGMPPFTEAQYGDVWYRPAIAGRWEVFWSFKEKAMKARSQGPKVFGDDFKTLLTQLLCPDEILRPNIQEIRESDWYKKVKCATYEEVSAEMNKRKTLIR